MRRLAALIIFFLMCFSVSFAEEIDFSNMDLEQLASIRMAADEEIAKRYGEGWEILNSGYYLIGEDIRSGSYEVLAINLEEDESSVFCKLYKNNNNDDDELVFYKFIDLGEKFTFKAADGNLLYITWGTLLIREAPKSKYAP